MATRTPATSSSSATRRMIPTRSRCSTGGCPARCRARCGPTSCSCCSACCCTTRGGGFATLSELIAALSGRGYVLRHELAVFIKSQVTVSGILMELDPHFRGAAHGARGGLGGRGGRGLRAAARISTHNDRQLDLAAGTPLGRRGAPLRLAIEARYRDLRSLHFFGIGNASGPAQATYRQEERSLAAAIEARLGRLATARAELRLLDAGLAGGSRGAAIGERHDAAALPGYPEQPDDMVYGITAGAGRYDPRSPATGLAVELSARRFAARGRSAGGARTAIAMRAACWSISNTAGTSLPRWRSPSSAMPAWSTTTAPPSGCATSTPAAASACGSPCATGRRSASIRQRGTRADACTSARGQASRWTAGRRPGRELQRGLQRFTRYSDRRCPPSVFSASSTRDMLRYPGPRVVAIAAATPALLLFPSPIIASWILEPALRAPRRVRVRGVIASCPAPRCARRGWRRRRRAVATRCGCRRS